MKDFIQASRKWGLQKPRCISERERECVCVSVCVCVRDRASVVDVFDLWSRFSEFT